MRLSTPILVSTAFLTVQDGCYGFTVASLNVLPIASQGMRGEAGLPTLRDQLAMLQRDLSGLVDGVDTLAERLSRVGRPPVLSRPEVRKEWSSVKTDLAAGRITRLEAARTLGVSRRSVDRLLATTGELEANTSSSMGTR